jgi:hypothetical protein
MKTVERFGLPLVDLPPVDFREIAKRIKSVIDTIQKHDSEDRRNQQTGREDFFSSKILSDKIKKTLTFFFNLKGRACSLDV